MSTINTWNKTKLLKQSGLDTFHFSGLRAPSRGSNHPGPIFDSYVLKVSLAPTAIQLDCNRPTLTGSQVLTRVYVALRVFKHINCSMKAPKTIFVIMTLENWLARNKIVITFQNCELILMQSVSLFVSLSMAAVTVSTIECRPSMRKSYSACRNDKRNKLYAPT